jgi:hypothetical protein
MKTAFKIIGIFFLVIILSAAGVAAYLYSNQTIIKNYVIKKINEQLTAKIAIQEIDLELFSQFPKVSLDLIDVKISDPIQNKKYLLIAQHVFIGFSLYDIISKNYNIKLITLDSGSCNLYTDKKARKNFDIIKRNNSNSENIFLQLNQVQINKIALHYLDLESSQEYKAILNKVELSGSFNNTKEDIACVGKMYVEQLKTGSVTLIKNKSIDLDFVLAIDSKKEVFTIQKGSVGMDELKLDAQGNIKNSKKNIFIDVSFSARQLSIQSLLSMMPFKLNAITEYESSGDIYFKGIVKGNMNMQEQPNIEIDFGIKNGKLNRSINNLSIQNINCVGHFSNGKKRKMETSLLELKSVSMQLKDGNISGNLSVTNFVQPFIDTDLKGHLDASQLISLFNNKNISSANGDVSFNLNLHGKLANFSNKNNWGATQSAGSFDIDLQHIKLNNEQKEIESLKASLTLNQNDVTINSFTSSLQKSDITIKGKFINVIPYILLDKQKLEADIDYTSDYIDLEHFIMPIASNKDNDEAVLQLPENILLIAKVKVNKFVFHEFNAANLTAIINWKGKKLSIENLNCQTMNGNILANGQIENTDDGRFFISSTSTLKNININELFRQCNNFGQTELTNKHLFGMMNATFDLASVWSSKLDCDLEKLYTFGEVQILNGEVIDYKPLESLSKYVDVEDLRHLRFAELKNKIEIKNKTIFIPSMDMRSNALNITLSGTHTFDNMLDYKLKLKLSELLKKKRKPSANEFGEEEETDGKGLYLYLTMKGPIDNLKFNYDKVGVKNKMKLDIKIEKENIKDIFKKELGIGKDSSIKEKKINNDELEFEKE